MKLHDNYVNEVLIDMAGLLAYDNNLVESIKDQETGYKEVLQDEVVDLSLYFANKFLNEYQQDDTTSPLQNQRNFFNDNKDNLIRNYYQDTLPPIVFKDDRLIKYNREKSYLTVGDIRMSNYDDNTVIISENDYGEKFALRNAKEFDTRIDNIDPDRQPFEYIDNIEEYKKENPDAKLIKGLVFDF